MLTLADLATLPRRGFCRGEGGDLHIEEYEYVNVKPLLPPISIQIQSENSAKRLSGADCEPLSASHRGPSNTMNGMDNREREMRWATGRPNTIRGWDTSVGVTGVGLAWKNGDREGRSCKGERNERHLETRPFTKMDYPSETTETRRAIDRFTTATNGPRRGRYVHHAFIWRNTVRLYGQKGKFGLSALRQMGLFPAQEKWTWMCVFLNCVCYCDLRLVDTRDRVGKSGSSRCSFELFLFTMFRSLGWIESRLKGNTARLKNLGNIDCFTLHGQIESPRQLNKVR